MSTLLDYLFAIIFEYKFGLALGIGVLIALAVVIAEVKHCPGGACELRKSFKELTRSIFELLGTLVESLARKIRDFPYVVCGANPYAFKEQSGLHITIQSKIKINIFGVMAISVVGYIGAASYNMAKNVFKHDEVLSIITSAILSIIVLQCDRFILAYPKEYFDTAEITNDIKISNIKNDALKYTTRFFYWIWKRCVRTAHTITLNSIRILLAISISMFMVLITYFQSNHTYVDYITRQYILNAEKNATSASQPYKKYTSAYEAWYQNEFTYLAATACADSAWQGTTTNGTKIYTNEDFVISFLDDSGKSHAAQDISVNGYICNLRSSNKCSKSIIDRCEEYNYHHAIANKHEVKKKELADAINSASKDTEEFKRNIWKPIKDQPPTHSTVSEATAHPQQNEPNNDTKEILGAGIYAKAIIQHYINELKREDGIHSVLSEIGIFSPLLIILLAFELLPTICKITFPPTAYERMVAWEDAYNKYAARSPADATADAIWEKLKLDASAMAMHDSFIKLGNYQKTKEGELSTKFKLVIEKFIVVAENICDLSWRALLGIMFIGIASLVVLSPLATVSK